MRVSRLSSSISLTTIAASLTLVVGACSDPLETCSAGASCVAAGETDLAVKEVSVRGQADAESGLEVVNPGEIFTQVVVWNKGPAASVVKSLLIQLGGADVRILTIPSLQPGELFDPVLRINPPDVAFLTNSDTTRITASIVGVDTDDSNDTRASDAFHLALPALRVTTTLDSGFLRANAIVPATVRVENVSRFAALGTSTLAYCIYAEERLCNDEPRGAAFDKVTLPAIPAGGSVTLDKPVVVPSTAVDQNRTLAYRIATCVVAGNDQRDVIGSGTCADARRVIVAPDYEACAPTRLVPGQSASGSVLCQNPCVISVYSANVEPGRTYVVEKESGQEDVTLHWRTRYRENPIDASAAPGFQPVVAGTLYLVTAHKYCGGASATDRVILREIQ